MEVGSLRELLAQIAIPINVADWSSHHLALEFPLFLIVKNRFNCRLFLDPGNASLNAFIRIQPCSIAADWV